MPWAQFSVFTSPDGSCFATTLFVRLLFIYFNMNMYICGSSHIFSDSSFFLALCLHVHDILNEFHFVFYSHLPYVIALFALNCWNSHKSSSFISHNNEHCAIAWITDIRLFAAQSIYTGWIHTKPNLYSYSFNFFYFCWFSFLYVCTICEWFRYFYLVQSDMAYVRLQSKIAFFEKRTLTILLKCSNNEHYFQNLKASLKWNNQPHRKWLWRRLYHSNSKYDRKERKKTNSPRKYR